MKAVDLYAGIGGWTLGLKMAGIDVVKSYEWWSDANVTHNKNFNLNHPTIDIRKLDPKTVPSAKIVVGSPPCTQFSFSNRGGNGDINEGIKDLLAFLNVVEKVEPKYWAMENVPRVAGILEKLISKGGSLHRFQYLFKDIQVVNSADFGVPQNRERMIAGNFPFDLFNSYKSETEKLSLGEVVDSLKNDVCYDPIYGIKMKREDVTDQVIEDSLSFEEERINRESKNYHPVYNKMNFPEIMDRPSRTVTALCTRVSRESIIIKQENSKYRRLSVRERGLIQSFPINYQFHSKSYGGKLKMIGNAIPPLLTFYIAQSMLKTPADKLITPSKGIKNVKLSKEKAIELTPDTASRKFKINRSFWMAIPNLRFGSGMRFDLKNHFKEKVSDAEWKINFFYGTSKEIKELIIDQKIYKSSLSLFDKLVSDELKTKYRNFSFELSELDAQQIQRSWITSSYKNIHHPFKVVDNIGSFAEGIIRELRHNDNTDVLQKYINSIFHADNIKINKKILDNSASIFAGLIIAGIFNRIIFYRKTQLNREVVAA